MQPVTPSNPQWTDVWAIWIAIAAFGLSLINSIGLLVGFLIQRYDKKPKLLVTVWATDVTVRIAGRAGGTTAHPALGFMIDVRNISDKTIKVDSISLVDTNKLHHNLPKEWGSILDVPSHEKRSLQIPFSKFNEFVRIGNPFGLKKSQFVITDALGNQYKSEKLGKAIPLDQKLLAQFL
jgi:hypothetical protein